MRGGLAGDDHPVRPLDQGLGRSGLLANQEEISLTILE
jgi:hypothetical protein